MINGLNSSSENQGFILDLIFSNFIKNYSKIKISEFYDADQRKKLRIIFHFIFNHKFMQKLKKIATFLTISLFVYLGIAFTLVFWKVPPKKDIKNYDFSSLEKMEKSKAEEHWLTLRDSGKLFYRFYPSDAPCTFIFIHGSGSESRYLENFATFMTENKLARVITPDLRGHGRTSGIKGDIDYLGQYEDDLEDIVQFVKAKYPNQKIILGGHSSGGGLALRYAGNQKLSDVDAFLLFSPYLGHEAPTVKPNSGEWVTVAIKRFIGLAMLNNIGISQFDYLPVIFFNRPQKWNDKLQTQSYSYRLSKSYEPKNYIDDIKNNLKPTLVVVGDLDESFNPEQFQMVFKDGKATTVERIANANHIGIVRQQEVKDRVSKWYGLLNW
jgi:non-heme chloroperoxidase